VLSGQYEVITDEGWLNSPYRSVRFFIGTDQQGQQPEIYPNTRSSNAASIRAKYFLPYRAAIDAMYRFYTDTWGVVGHTAELGYVHPLDTAWVGGNWIFEGRVRYYTQVRRGFLHGHLPARRLQQFHGARQGTRHLQRHHRGLGATYEFKVERFPWLSKGQVNFRYDHMMITYDDFRDARYSLGSFRHVARRAAAAGTEPLYELDCKHLPALLQRVLLTSPPAVDGQANTAI
jgi:hypothetical protein